MDLFFLREVLQFEQAPFFFLEVCMRSEFGLTFWWGLGLGLGLESAEIKNFGTEKPVAENDSITRRSKYPCIVDAHECTIKSIGKTQQKDHEDHTAGRRVNSMSHYNLVHKFTFLCPKHGKSRIRKPLSTKSGKSSTYCRQGK